MRASPAATTPPTGDAAPWVAKIAASAVTLSWQTNRYPLGEWMVKVFDIEFPWDDPKVKTTPACGLCVC
jgi:hypothetical protein